MKKVDLPKPEDIGLKICGDRILVLVEDVDDETVTNGGIVLPNTGKNKEMSRAAQNVGVVVMIGPMAWSDMSEKWAELGDKVSFGRYAGTAIFDPKTELTFKMLVDTDINAVYIA